MKKALSFVLALVLLLSVFAGMTVFADAPEWNHILVFTYSGYDYHKSAENITAEFRDTDWSWAFDGISAYLEVDGERATGIIEAGVNYTLVIKLKIIPRIDEYYGFSSIPKEQIRLYSRSANEYYSDGEYLIAKFALTPYQSAYDTVSFRIDGYAVGADADDVVITADMDGFGIHKSTELLCRESAESTFHKATGEIKAGWEYSLVIMYTIPEGTEVYFGADAVLYGASDLPIVTSSGQNQIITHEGPAYMTRFTLPVLEEEQLAGDVDGDGEVTVADALLVLRVAAKLAQPTKSTGSAFDFDGDGEVTVADALSVLRIAAKLA
ncbi:MAG: dockerin type I repeat-containing protein [Clostridia bacterium]|nr:dockerin type I repeat-containing protein [Clostridia bacterium]